MKRQLTAQYHCSIDAMLWSVVNTSSYSDDGLDSSPAEPGSPTVILDKKTKRRFLDLGSVPTGVLGIYYWFYTFVVNFVTDDLFLLAGLHCDVPMEKLRRRSLTGCQWEAGGFTKVTLTLSEWETHSLPSIIHTPCISIQQGNRDQL